MILTMHYLLIEIRWDRLVSCFIMRLYYMYNVVCKHAATCIVYLLRERMSVSLNEESIIFYMYDDLHC